MFQGNENSESAYKAAIIPNDPASTNRKFRCDVLHLPMSWVGQFITLRDFHSIVSELTKKSPKIGLK